MAISAGEARAVAKEAYIYGFPLVDSYRIQYAYFVDRGGPEYKTSWNQIYNNARVYTPEDRVIQTPNSDTPYSFLGADLRAEPLVVSLPAVDKGRYYSAQFIDMYTFNFAYAGSRATGAGAVKLLLAGPHWKGHKAEGISEIVHCETEFAFVLYRTQLFNPDDIVNVKKIQAGYKVQSLSAFLHEAPPPSPTVNFIKPLSSQQERSSLAFFSVLNFVLRFCPTHPSERALMSRFALLGIGASGNFDARSLSQEIQKAVEDGIGDAWKEFDEFKANQFGTGKVQSGDITGTRAHLKNNYLYRMAAAALGIYGNSKEEAIYPVYFVDSAGEKLDGNNRYTLRFQPGQLPPVKAFWSLTVYELPSSLLVANPLNRYLINSAMLPGLKRDPDGGLTLYIQHESPGKDREANWLPAPRGPFMAALRLYWPKPSALDGNWKAPPLLRFTSGEMKKAV